MTDHKPITFDCCFGSETDHRLPHSEEFRKQMNEHFKNNPGVTIADVKWTNPPEKFVASEGTHPLPNPLEAEYKKFTDIIAHYYTKTKNGTSTPEIEHIFRMFNLLSCYRNALDLTRKAYAKTKEDKMTDERRREFEQWYKDHMDGLDEAIFDKDRNCYTQHSIHLAWCAWNARAEPVPDEAMVAEAIYKRALDKDLSICWEFEYTEYEMKELAKAAIEAMGGRAEPVSTHVLPHDVQIGSVIFRKGVALSTLINAAKRWKETSLKDSGLKIPTEQDVKNLRESIANLYEEPVPDDVMVKRVARAIKHCPRNGAEWQAKAAIAAMRGDTLRAAAVQALAALTSGLQENDGCEINPSNYRHDDVCNINNGYVGIFQSVEQAITALETALKE